MSGQTITVHLRVPMDPRLVEHYLEAKGFEVDGITEMGGSISNTPDVIAFVVEHLDDLVIGSLAGVVANLISSTPDPTLPKRGASFSVKQRSGGETYIIKVKGDQNFVQVHPRPNEDE